MSSPLSTTSCIYCLSADTVRRGFRQKKREKVQLYLCRSCLKTFTPQAAKGKHYPVGAIIDALSYYNLGFSFEQVCKILSKKYDDAVAEGAVPLPKLRSGVAEAKGLPRLQHRDGTMPQRRAIIGTGISPSTIANWVEEYKDLCRYHRYRPFALKMFRPEEVIEHATLAHRQLYRFMFHRAKIQLIIREDIKHARFGPLADFLAQVSSETPHQYFTAEGSYDGLRASEAPVRFSKENMIVRSKHNFANKLAAFALQGVKQNKDRHEAVQKFMLANDTVTVATEVPVYLKREDLLHMQTQLGFEIYAREKGRGVQLRQLSAAELPKLITGHIDLLQVRNGQIHILDYKPRAAKEKPIEQLTLYAMALSRLTGLRMYCFKCAWFDEKDYFEFFPLHVVYKRKGRNRKIRSDRKQIATKEGVYQLNESPTDITLKPTLA